MGRLLPLTLRLSAEAIPPSPNTARVHATVALSEVRMPHEQYKADDEDSDKRAENSEAVAEGLVDFTVLCASQTEGPQWGR
jgi:hypothetical protein